MGGCKSSRTTSLAAKCRPCREPGIDGTSCSLGKSATSLALLLAATTSEELEDSWQAQRSREMGMCGYRKYERLEAKNNNERLSGMSVFPRSPPRCES